MSARAVGQAMPLCSFALTLLPYLLCLHLAPVTCSSSSSSSNGEQQACLWDSDACLADNLESNLTLVRTSSLISCPSCCRCLLCFLPPGMDACMCAHAPVCLSPLAVVAGCAAIGVKSRLTACLACPFLFAAGPGWH
jgi:hypothetical protein